MADPAVATLERAQKERLLAYGKWDGYEFEHGWITMIVFEREARAAGLRVAHGGCGSNIWWSV